MTVKQKQVLKDKLQHYLDDFEHWCSRDDRYEKPCVWFETIDGWSNWKDYKLGYEIYDRYEYRKVEKKTWMEEYLAINCDDKIEAHNSKIDIENVCKKILEEMENRALSGVSATTLRNIIKDLGVEV